MVALYLNRGKFLFFFFFQVFSHVHFLATEYVCWINWKQHWAHMTFRRWSKLYGKISLGCLDYLIVIWHRVDLGMHCFPIIDMNYWNLKCELHCMHTCTCTTRKFVYGNFLYRKGIYNCAVELLEPVRCNPLVWSTLTVNQPDPWAAAVKISSDWCRKDQ